MIADPNQPAKCGNCYFLRLVKPEPVPGKPVMLGAEPIPMCYGGPPMVVMTPRGPVGNRGVPTPPEAIACALWQPARNDGFPTPRTDA